MKSGIFFLFLALLHSRNSKLFGQNLEYPVQAMIQINAPAPVYLSDYTSGINPALKVSLLLKDLSQTAPVLVKLRFTVEGRGNQQNILLTSKKDLYANLPEISLVAGNYTEIDNTVLASYLNPVNMDISGVNYNDFIQTGGRLPEGAYYFYVEAIVVGRNVKVSNTALSTAMIMLNEPPKWISPWMLPAANTLMKPILPQNIYFSWICQHFSTLATNTEYDFTLAEFLPAITPEDALDETKANSYRHTFTVQQPFVLYNAVYPMLEIGKKYVCRIKAKDKDDKEVFKNKGYSQILEFTYGQPCPALGLVSAVPISAWQTDFKWTKKPEQTTVKLRYREQNPDGSYSEWYTDETGKNQYSLQNLKASKTYQYEAIGMCDDLPGEKTEGIFTMPAITEKYENTCGKDVPVEPIDRNSPPLQELKVGDQINAGGFNATITAASGGNGIFSGDCVVDFTPLGIKLKAKFNSISLNNKKQLTAGEINVVEDPDRMIIDVDETAFLFNDLLMDAQIAIDGVPSYLSKLEEMLNQLKDNSQLSQKTHNDLLIIKKKLEEFEQKYNNGSLALTSDQLSKIQELKNAIDQNLQKGILSKKEIFADGKTRVYFRQGNDPAKGEIYGFDEKQYDVFEKQYDKLTFSNTDVYYVSYMSLEKNRFTNIKVDITVEEGKLKPEDIKFRNSMGIDLPLIKEGNNNYLLVRDFSTGDEDEIIAYYLEENEKGIKQEKIAGKLIVKIYEPVQKNLVVVPVTTEKPDRIFIETEINKIYRQGITGFKIQMENPITISGWDNNHTFDNGKSDILSNYTSDMKTVINKYKDTLNACLEDNTLYIFLINYPTSDRKNGYMPRARNCGFIFIQNFKTNNPNYTTATAHELGHGAFNLTHPFDKFNFPASTTNNLMDYRDSTHLIEYQWGEIHNPNSVLLPWFQGDKGGAIMNRGTLLLTDIKDIIDQIRQGNKDKKSEMPIKITTGLGEYDKITLGSKNYSYIKMALIGFNPLLDNVAPTTIQTITGQFTLPIERPLYNLKPSELSITSFIETGTKYIKYQYHEMQTKQNNAPYAEIKEATGVVRIEICVKEKEQMALENYLLGRDTPKPGDPLINMRIVHSNSVPNSGGMFGCARIGSGCDQSTIPNLPKYSNNKKVHDGVDLFANLNTDVFAMYDGEIVGAENSVPQNEEGTQGALGNRILVRHTATQHGQNSNIIYVMYGHLNVVESTIHIGIKVKQGQKIGESGKTGNASDIEAWRYHVHLMVYENGTGSENKVDPRTYLTTKFDNNGHKIE